MALVAPPPPSPPVRAEDREAWSPRRGRSDASSVLCSNPATTFRSAVPDLLFEDVTNARVDELGLLLDDPYCVDAATRLHRVTVFVT